MIGKETNWQEYLPRGTKAMLARKYNLTRTAVGKIIKREDVVNHPGLIKEAFKLAMAGKKAQSSLIKDKKKLRSC